MGKKKLTKFEREEFNPTEMKNSFAHMKAYANFDELNFFKWSCLLAEKFCEMNLAEFRKITDKIVKEFHPDELEAFDDDPKTQQEIYEGYDLFNKKKQEFLNEMLFCKCIDFFLEYLKDLLCVITLSNYDTIEIKREFSLKEILSAKDIAELIEKLIAGEIAKISNADKRILKQLLEKFGLGKILSEAEMLKLNEYISKRNIICHGRGIRNIYTHKGKNKTKVHHISKTTLDKANSDLWRYITKIDNAAMKKYKLVVGGALLLKFYRLGDRTSN